MTQSPYSPPHSAWSRSGVPQALGAYLVWGLIPIFFNLLHKVTPVELVAWRVLFTLPFCLSVIAVRRQGPALRAALTQHQQRLAHERVVFADYVNATRNVAASQVAQARESRTILDKIAARFWSRD